jgi:hypothetical protein
MNMGGGMQFTLNEILWLPLSTEMMGFSTEKNVALFLGHTCKPMLVLKGRGNIITILKQSQATASSSKHRLLQIF